MDANRISSSSLVGLSDQAGFALLGAQPEVDQQRGVAAVVQDHVGGAAVAPLEDAMLVVPVVGQGLALDGEHRRAAGRDGGGGMVLGRVDVAGGPAHVGAERPERLDQHRGLDRHVQRAADARAAQRLGRAELLARRHQARHLGLGDGDLLAAPFGQPDVLDHVIGGGLGVGGALHGFRRGFHDGPWLAGNGGYARRHPVRAVPIAGPGQRCNNDIKNSLCR